MYSWFIQRRVGTIASPFFCQKTVILYFENSIGPSPRTSRSWRGNNRLIFHICQEDRPKIYMEDQPTRAYPRTTVFIFFILLYFYKRNCLSSIRRLVMNQDNRTIFFACVLNVGRVDIGPRLD
jgi:hypothetical protein